MIKILPGAKVGHNKLFYRLLGVALVSRWNADKFVVEESVRVKCVSPKKPKKEIKVFKEGTIFTHSRCK